jgi:hypothetical protein
MTIITKGMGAIMKGAKKRKTLTLSFPKSKPKPPPRKGEVIIKKKSKPSKTKLADTWQDRRIQAINRKIGAGQGWVNRKRHSQRIKQHESYIDEVSDIYKSKAPTKKVYKSVQKKWHSLDPDQKSKIYMKKAKRDPKSFYFDKKKFGKK